MLDQEYLLNKKAEYEKQMAEYQRNIYALQGAIQAVDEMLADLGTPEPQPLSGVEIEDAKN